MNKYYTYTHVCPDTKEVVYVGVGSEGRAWLCSGARADDHTEWMRELLSRGVTPDEWVVIGDRGLSKKEALEIELMLIHNFRPRFNKNFNRPTVLDKEQVEFAKQLREDGLSFSAIARELEVSTMTAYRAIKGETFAHT